MAAPREERALPRGRTRLFEDGFIHTNTGAETTSGRHSGTLLLALGNRPFEIEAGGLVSQAHAVAVRPCTVKRLQACGVPFACIDATPQHPMYRAFASIVDPGYQVLPQGAFDAVMPALDAYAHGRLNARASRPLYRRIFEIASGLLASPPPLDPRIARVLALLDADPALGVAQLASAVHVSRDRLSHLFSQEMGLPVRRYSQSLKIRAAAQLFGKGLNLTQIAAAAGFSDSAHFSKIWAQAYGAPPAYFFMSGSVKVYTPPTRRGTAPSASSSRLRSRNAANNHERMPTTKV